MYNRKAASLPASVPWVTCVILLLASTAAATFGQSHNWTCNIQLPPGFADGNYVTQTWPAGCVPYVFDGNVTTENQMRALLAMADALLWTTYTATPPGEWETAVVCVGDLIGRTEPLIFALKTGRLPAPNDMLKIRNVRLYDNRIVLHPGDLNCDGAVEFSDINPFVALLVGRP